MGKVLLAHDTSSGRDVAVKILLGQLQGNRKALARFTREALIQGSLDHPHVVKLFDQDLSGEHPYLVMELVSGETLEERLGRGAMKPDEVERLGRELASGIAELHRRQVLHRDLKPANVMIRSQDASAVIMDLGLVLPCDVTALTATGAVVGTPFYLPPEVMTHFVWSPQADLFQIGALLFHALTGKLHLELGEPGEVLNRIKSGSWVPIPPELEAPAPLKAAILKALSLHPRDRQRSAEELLQELTGEEPRRTIEEWTLDSALPFDATSEDFTLPPDLKAPSLPPDVSPHNSPKRNRQTFLLALCLAAGMGLGLGFEGGRPPPCRVTWSVVGGAVLAEVLNPPGTALHLEIDGQSVASVPGGSEGPVRLVGRGLRFRKSGQVSLVWKGGKLGPVTLSGEADALGSSLSLGGKNQLQIRVRRPCLVAWSPPFQGSYWLPRGEHLLPVPPLEEVRELVWMEKGISFSRQVSSADLIDTTLRQLTQKLVDANLEDSIAKPGSPGPPPLESYRRAWIPLRNWVPFLLGDLPKKRCQELWQLWQTWRLSLDRARFAGRDPASIEVPRDQIGSLHAGLPSWPEAHQIKIPLTPSNGVYASHGKTFKIHLKRRRIRFHSVDPEKIFFSWPRDIPRSLASLALAVSVRVPSGGEALCLQVQPRQNTSSFGGFQLWTFYPPNNLNRRWISLCIPRSLFPPPGTPMQMEFLPFSTEFSTYVKIFGMRIILPGETGGKR
jgi:hypothetical protein